MKAPFSFTVTILPFFSGVVGFARSPRCFYIVRGFEFYDPHYQTSDELTKPTPPVGERVGIYGKESAATSPLVTALSNCSDVGIRAETDMAGEQPRY